MKKMKKPMTPDDFDKKCARLMKMLRETIKEWELLGVINLN